MILFRNVRIMELDPPSVSEPMDVAVFEPEENAHGGTIAEIGGSLQTKYPKAKIAGEGGFLSPGLVCGHTHLYSALSRGMLVDIDHLRILHSFSKICGGDSIEQSTRKSCAPARLQVVPTRSKQVLQALWIIMPDLNA